MNLIKWLEQAKLKIETRLNNLLKIVKKIYEDNIDNLIDDETYHQLLNKYITEKKDLHNKLDLIQLGYKKESNKLQEFDKLKETILSINDVKKLLESEVLTSSIINKLIS